MAKCTENKRDMGQDYNINKLARMGMYEKQALRVGKSYGLHVSILRDFI